MLCRRDCFLLLPTVFLLAARALSISAPVPTLIAASEYEAFRSEQERIREKLQEYEIVCVEHHRHDDSEAIVSSQATNLRFRGSFEVWKRYALEQGESPAHAIDALRALTPRSIDITDGSRAVRLQRHSTTEGAVWQGVLTPEPDNRIKAGGVNCGLFFGEQWLADCLQSFDLHAQQRSGDTDVYELRSKDPSSGDDRRVGVHSGRLEWINWYNDSKLAIEARVTSHRALGELSVIQEAEITYHYGTSVKIASEFSYEETGILPSEQCRLLSIPNALIEQGHDVELVDLLTRKTVPLGSSEAGSPLQAPVAAGTPILTTIVNWGAALVTLAAIVIASVMVVRRVRGEASTPSGR